MALTDRLALGAVVLAIVGLGLAARARELGGPRQLRGAIRAFASAAGAPMPAPPPLLSGWFGTTHRTMVRARDGEIVFLTVLRRASDSTLRWRVTAGWWLGGESPPPCEVEFARRDAVVAALRTNLWGRARWTPVQTGDAPFDERLLAWASDVDVARRILAPGVLAANVQAADQRVLPDCIEVSGGLCRVSLATDPDDERIARFCECSRAIVRAIRKTGP